MQLLWMTLKEQWNELRKLFFNLQWIRGKEQPALRLYRYYRVAFVYCINGRFVSDLFRSGFVSLIGRPNVGKSTLLNQLLGQKISIVTSKPQTTRNRILGIKTAHDAQIVFIDTPGIHKPTTLLGTSMMRAVHESLREIDLVILVTEAMRSFQEDSFIAGVLGDIRKPVILAINKTDKVKKPRLLILIDEYSRFFRFKEIIPVSALHAEGTDLLLEKIIANLPLGPQYYPEKMVTDQIERSMVAEIIREKIMDVTSDEVPHSVAVEVVEWTERKEGTLFISAHIFVEREGQKGIIIGKNGSMLKRIGKRARIDIEKILNTGTFLQLWVKVRKEWRDNQKVLHDMGYS